MNLQPYSSTDQYESGRYAAARFYTETIEVPRMAALTFFEAGSRYAGERMFWQNPESTMTFVGLGHAHKLTAGKTGRFKEIKADWEALCRQLVREETGVQPMLFGGFSFDPANSSQSVWKDFSPAYFAVPTFQLVIRDERAFVSIHLITDGEPAAEEFDRLRRERDELIHTAQTAEPESAVKPAVSRLNELEKEAYLQSISSVTDAIKAQKAEKVVIARALELEFEQKVSHAGVLGQTASEQPGSFLFGLESGSQLFFGATPERLVKVTANRALSTCLAGSTPRGETAKEDALLGEALLNDTKNRSEHAYVVNMISSVFRRHCSEAVIPPVPKLMKIRDIQHLYTPVEGTLKPEATLFDLVQELHPTPALGGEPRETALRLIREYEPMDRGFYAAPVGWVDAEGNGEFAVAIRSALIDRNRAYLFAGGGIVEDSTPEAEYAETWVKFRPMLRALGGKMRDES